MSTSSSVRQAGAWELGFLEVDFLGHGADLGSYQAEMHRPSLPRVGTQKTLPRAFCIP